MKKRRFYEYILLLILFILASPFLLIIFGSFIIIYIIIFPIEGLFYFKSKYYLDLKEKYFLFITFTDSYKKYNNFNYEINELISINEEIHYDYESSLWIINKDDLNTYLSINYPTNKNIIIIIKKELINKNDIRLAKLSNKFIIYSK